MRITLYIESINKYVSLKRKNQYKLVFDDFDDEVVIYYYPRKALKRIKKLGF